MKAASPSWDERNLVRHHAKRVTRDRGCFEDLLGITGRLMTVEEFRERSLGCVLNVWLEYEARSYDQTLRVYLEARAAYVDGDLVVAWTDLDRARFVTCFHEHFQNGRRLHGWHPGRGATMAQLRLKYHR